MTRSLSFRLHRCRAALTAAALAVPFFVSSVAFAAGPVDKKVERAWKANCASCHGLDGKGKTEKGTELGIPDMTAASWQKKLTDDQMRKSINDGVNEVREGKKKEMDPFKEKLKPEQVDGIIAFIRSLVG